MLFNTTPDDFGLNFNSRTPMSVGVWALLVASIFAFVAFVDSLVRDGRLRFGPARGLAGLLDGTVGLVWNVIGAALYLFIAGYTGVLLAVSNQPVWSDSWALGGLFLASGLTGSAALLLILTRYRRDAAPSRPMLEISERIFTVLELLLLVVVVLTLIDDGTLGDAFGFPWILLWLVAVAAMLPGLRDLAVSGLRVRPEGGAVAGRVPVWLAMSWLVLVGVLFLRAAVIFSAQS
jgi:formate-dependent nitrite reductase membrane component NrfD